MNSIMALLQASRPDMIDGFPAKCALRALTEEGSPQDKLNRMNEQLIKHRIIAIFRDKIVKPDSAYYSNHSLIGAHINPNGFIEVYMKDSFFEEVTNPLEKALRFQSIVTHELVHRRQIEASHGTIGNFRSDEDLEDASYINNPIELEAMCTEVLHDMATSKVLADSSILSGSPRLNFLLDNARYLTEDSVKYFQEQMKQAQKAAA